MATGVKSRAGALLGQTTLESIYISNSRICLFPLQAIVLHFFLYLLYNSTFPHIIFEGRLRASAL